MHDGGDAADWLVGRLSEMEEALAALVEVNSWTENPEGGRRVGALLREQLALPGLVHRHGLVRALGDVGRRALHRSPSRRADASSSSTSNPLTSTVGARRHPGQRGAPPVINDGPTLSRADGGRCSAGAAEVFRRDGVEELAELPLLARNAVDLQRKVV